jgi:2-keto-4-pentenoate hydratase/2-oxohepta-3-ene-1,7-dioic acid hydratase in catechol pathway
MTTGNSGSDADKAALLPLSAVSLRPPVPDPRKIICLGRNYRAHAREAGLDVPVAPELFAKFANTLIGHGESIQLPAVSNQIDYEAELAVVIGRRAHNVSKNSALEHVAGYTILNDVTARDYQFRTSQWLAGKGFDTFGPVGPWLVTADEIPDPGSLQITLDIGRERMQSSTTANMIFSVSETIEYVSHIMTLEPGDIISMGTPEGVGFKRNPPRFLRAGDVVSITVEGIGTLANPVAAPINVGQPEVAGVRP